MRAPVERLPELLRKGLAPVYLITGDEPLQSGEAADSIRRQARELGYCSREVMEHNASFNWSALTVAADSLSLFSEQRIIDLRLSSNKIGTEGSKAIAAYLQRPPADTLLLITAPKLERSQLTSKWVKAIEKVGLLVQIWPLEGKRLRSWIQQRMTARGLKPEAGAVALLAERVEGNLLAAAQEIEKILLLQGPGAVTGEKLLACVSDSARFDVYALVDAALQGNLARVQRLLWALKAEGIPLPVVLWALAREIRAMARMAAEVSNGNSPAQVMTRQHVWDKRKTLVGHGLQRLGTNQWRSLLQGCADADRIIKGQGGSADPWETLLTLCTRMAGAEYLPN